MNSLIKTIRTGLMMIIAMIDRLTGAAAAAAGTDTAAADDPGTGAVYLIGVDRYYVATVLIHFSDYISDKWDCGCDETFAVAAAIKRSSGAGRPVADVHIQNYQLTTATYFNRHKHDTFTPDGGI